MKFTSLLIALTLTVISAQAQGIAQPRPMLLPDDIDIATIKDAGRAAIQQVITEFAASKAAASTSYIIMPLTKDIDQGYFTLQFENAFTQKAGDKDFKLYTRTDKVLEKVLTEIEFQQNYEDSLKQGTLQKLALVGAEAVILPRIDIDRSGDGTVTLRASIGVHNVSSGEKAWGNESSALIPGRITPTHWITRGIYALAGIALLMIFIWFIRTVRWKTNPR